MQILSGGKHWGGKQWPAPLVFSPDGRHLAAGTDPVFSGTRILRVWNLETGGEPVRVLLEGICILQAFDFDSRFLLTTHQREVCRGEWQTGEFPPHRFLTKFHPHAISADGRFAITETHVPIADEGPDWVAGYLTVRAARNEEGKWVNAWRRRLEYIPQAEDDRGYSHLLISTGNRFVVWMRVIGAAAKPMPQTEVHLIDAQTGKIVVAHPRYITWRGFLPRLPNKAAVGPTGVLAVAKGGALYAVDPTDVQSPVVKRTNTTAKHFTDLAFSPDGKRLATVSRDAAVTMWDTATWEVQRQFAWKVGPLRSVAFAPDGLRCAAGSDTGQIVVWDLDD